MNGMEILGTSGNFKNSLFLGISATFFYPLVGYYLDRNILIEKLRASNIIWLFIITTIGIAVASACTYYEGIHGGMVFDQNYVSMTSYISSIFVFMGIKYLLNKKDYINNKCFRSSITTIGSLTFGIYLFEPIWKELFYRSFCETLALYNTIMVSFLWCLISMLLGGLFTFVLKRVPLIKKLL